MRNSARSTTTSTPGHVLVVEELLKSEGPVMEIDFSKLVADILDAIKGAVTTGFNKIKDALQPRMSGILAMRSKILASSGSRASSTEDEFADEVDRSQRLVKSIGMTVSALASITLEKAWNAIVKVVWGTINGVLKTAGLGALAVLICAESVTHCWTNITLNMETLDMAQSEIVPDLVFVSRSEWVTNTALPRLVTIVPRESRTHVFIHHTVTPDGDATPNQWETRRGIFSRSGPFKRFGLIWAWTCLTISLRLFLVTRSW